jgi:DNA invertase Pin-like site-specific DNA recombinase
VENAKTGGRPKDEIDQKTVFEMKLNGATYQDIADFFGVHKNTI